MKISKKDLKKLCKGLSKEDQVSAYCQFFNKVFKNKPINESLSIEDEVAPPKIVLHPTATEYIPISKIKATILNRNSTDNRYFIEVDTNSENSNPLPLGIQTRQIKH